METPLLHPDLLPKPPNPSNLPEFRMAMVRVHSVFHPGLQSTDSVFRLALNPSLPNGSHIVPTESVLFAVAPAGDPNTAKFVV